MMLVKASHDKPTAQTYHGAARSNFCRIGRPKQQSRSGSAMAATASPRATPLVDEKHAAESLKAFLHMDVDGDGMLNEEEFRRGLGSLGIEPAFVKILFNNLEIFF